MDYTTYLLMGIIIIQDLLHRVERKDLYSRIMCKDINDYKRLDDKPSEPTQSAHKKTLGEWRKRGE